ncbi:MAG TPA: XRE family transcriptional regulator [Dysgonamonadaceae bacterium]|nr:XRE family transcriptional regulator [Dysgonamonadaceae bacterium]
MSEEMKQIGLRLQGLREAMDMTQEEFATSCDIPVDDYIDYEGGKKDMTISLMKKISERFNIDTSILMFDDEPKMTSYFLTRKGKGMSINRVKTYKYQTLAGGFNHRKAEVFEVTIEPRVADLPLNISDHGGQEFNRVLEGRMKIFIDGKEFIMNEGDSIYFDASLPHGMQPMDGKPVKLLVVII